MECDDLIDRFGDHLDGRLDPALRGEVERHLATCASCRAATAGLGELWGDLEQERAQSASGAPAPRAGEDPRRRRFDLLLQAWRIGSGEARPRRRRLLAASLLIAGVAIGLLLPWSWRAPAATTAAGRDDAPRFLLALLERPPSGPPPDAATFRRIVGEYSAWAGALARDGHLVVAEKLRDDGRTVLRARAGAIESDGAPPSADEEWLGGFFLIRARDLSQALELARGSPHLRYGGRIEVREIERVGD